MRNLTQQSADRAAACPERNSNGSKAAYSTIGFIDRTVEEALEGIAAAGFCQTEILGQEPHVAQPLMGQPLRQFCTRLESLGLRATTVHAPMGYNVLGAPEENWRREKVQVLASYLRFAGALDATDLIIHAVPNPGFVPNADDPAVPGLIRQAVFDSLDDLVPVAEEASVRILLENLPYDCEYPYLTMGELRPLVDQYPAEQVGLVVDTGHAWTLKLDPAAEIHVAGCRLGGLHLQDVDGAAPNDQHWVPTHGDLDWDAIRRALGQVRYVGLWTFEVAHARHGETPEQLAQLTREVAISWGL